MTLPLSTDLSGFVCCPNCRSSLNPHDDGYRCANCQRIFPLERGVVRLVDATNYADSFGFQWQRYARTQMDHDASAESEKDFRRKTGLTPEELKGKLVLDVGCGMGRFADVATRWGARVVGVDLSAAAEVAARNLADRDFIALQADVFSLPFAPGSFDYIYSIGVLHHTPSCEQAVKALPPYLKPGGKLAVWLYSAYNPWYRFSDLYRRYTSRMSSKTLHGILQVAVPLVNGVDRALRVLPVIGRPLSGLVRYVAPVNHDPIREWRVLDTFDWYSPQYQSKHTYEEVFRWFESSGMEDLHVGQVPISVRGTKPLA
jgi:2-polyprenyl-3-methyl-5-hydroxy-6-metoxy-1,4-benzoquinol methylase